MPPAIKQFTGKYAFLSNFHKIKVGLRAWGKTWPTLEHAFQAAKTHIPAYRDMIRHASTPGAAKRMGRRVELRPDWEEVKLEVMLELLRIKFAPGSQLGRMLLKTQGHYLVEGNDWGDQFWGVSHGKGENWLGKLLMQVRDELAEQGEGVVVS